MLCSFTYGPTCSGGQRVFILRAGGRNVPYQFAGKQFGAVRRQSWPETFHTKKIQNKSMWGRNELCSCVIAAIRIRYQMTWEWCMDEESLLNLQECFLTTVSITERYWHGRAHTHTHTHTRTHTHTHLTHWTQLREDYFSLTVEINKCTPSLNLLPTPTQHTHTHTLLQ